MKSFLINRSHFHIRYHDFPGVETPVLFIHGLGCASSYDYPQVATCELLSRHRRIIIDLLGLGYSYKPTDYIYSIDNHVKILKEFIEKLNLNQVILYGHSMGGAVSIYLADKIRNRVEALIISEGNLDSGGGVGSRAIAAYSLSYYVKEGHENIIRELAETNGNWATTMKNSEPRAVSYGAKDLVNGCSPSWRELLYSFSFPRTYIFGDKSLPDPDEKELVRNGVCVVIVKDAGHNMANENPVGLANEISKGIGRKTNFH
ncbi:MAG: alpha/beta hydrolase [Desulfobacteraceae bacterium]|nr:alpha/beta hydrolase [Desulfobacteraceae bacterium]